ncbi:MAG: hypothetical protein IKG96_03360 [Bacteroidaceae bacterium]|nr:hypothetical protein [Bacteroidaceae bacterium]
MKKILFLALPLLLCMSCEWGTTTNGGDTDSLDTVTVIDSTMVYEVRGIAGDGTSMNVLELITDHMDTLDIEIPVSMIAGGVQAGDEVDVIYSKTEDGYMANIAINTTSLQHLWTQPRSTGGTQSLEISPEGHATTYDMPGVDYDAWSIHNGQLLLHSTRKAAVESSGYTDTFDILLLTPDTLVLGNADTQSVFWREN